MFKELKRNLKLDLNYNNLKREYKACMKQAKRLETEPLSLYRVEE